MKMEVTGQVGPATLADGVSTQPFRQGKTGEQIFSELHGRYYEQAYRGNVYTTGMQLTSIAAATFRIADATSATLATAAASTPIVGLWNQANSTVNAVILQATLHAIITASTSTGPGGFGWVGFTSQSAITVASQATPVNRKSFLATGSQIKGLSGLALTGLTTTGIFQSASALSGGSGANFSFVGTAVGQATVGVSTTENLDGLIIVPPGGILGLYCTTTPVAHSALASLTWEEVPA